MGSQDMVVFGQAGKCGCSCISNLGVAIRVLLEH